MDSSFKFDSLEEILKHSDVGAAIKRMIADSVAEALENHEVANPITKDKVKVSDLLTSYEANSAELSKIKLEKEEVEADKAQSELFSSLVSKDKLNLPEEYIDAQFRESCLSAPTDKMEAMIKSRKTVLENVTKNLRDTGNSEKETNRKYLDSLVAEDDNSNGKVSDDDFWTKRD